MSPVIRQLRETLQSPLRRSDCHHSTLSESTDEGIQTLLWVRVNIKTRISFLAYPLLEVLGKPILSNKQCRNPRCVYRHTRMPIQHTRAYKYTPMSIYYCLAFEQDFFFEVS